MLLSWCLALLGAAVHAGPLIKLVNTVRAMHTPGVSAGRVGILDVVRILRAASGLDR